MTDDELVVFLSDRDAAIMGLENLTADMLDQLPELKIISRMGVGLDNVDPGMLRDRGIRIGWTGGTNRRSVAELMIAFFHLRIASRRAALRGDAKRGTTAPSDGAASCGRVVRVARLRQCRQRRRAATAGGIARYWHTISSISRSSMTNSE